MKSPLQICCALALTSLFLTGCGAPKPPLPSGERIPVNTVPHSQTVNRSRLADEPPSLDPPDAASESAPVVLQAAPAENLSPSPDDQSAKE